VKCAALSGVAALMPLYQGTTLVGPHTAERQLGFSPCLRTRLRRVRPLGRTSNYQDGSASAAEGCLNQYKRCPQGLKPFLA
jgi:hypothetical protein